MYENKWKRRGKKERDRVCGCSIEIENSIVIIICGEVDSLPQALNSALET
ncbi:MAG TPA: hypothetical protein GX004_03940 [Firmicutes bacterium]|nr:hypothetical protein [Bacillota bacterium]